MNPLSLESVAKCKQCVALGCDHVPSFGSPVAALMIVGQSPGVQEVKHTPLPEPFVGPVGEMVDWMLDEAGFTREDVYLANALKCHPPGNRPGHPEELENCKKTWLDREIAYVNPKLVLILGKDAWRSCVHPSHEFKDGELATSKKRAYLISFHPGFHIRNGTTQLFVENIGRLVRSFFESK